MKLATSNVYDDARNYKAVSKVVTYSDRKRRY